MFSAAKAQYDLAMAWSEFSLSTFTATTMLANSGAKVLAASAALEKCYQPTQNLPQSFQNPLFAGIPPTGMIDPMRFALAMTQATSAFWSALLEPPKPAAKPLPLWWTAFTDPLMLEAPKRPPSFPYVLH